MSCNTGLLPATMSSMESNWELGLGGGCHWCTEAVFRSVAGVCKVRQGFLSTRQEPDQFSEGIWLSFDPKRVSLPDLVAIHLWTHSSSSDHHLRHRYRSALYWKDPVMRESLVGAVENEIIASGKTRITTIEELGSFRDSPEHYQDYYARKPGAPFCMRYIWPKLEWLRGRYPGLYRALPSVD